MRCVETQTETDSIPLDNLSSVLNAAIVMFRRPALRSRMEYVESNCCIIMTKMRLTPRHDVKWNAWSRLLWKSVNVKTRLCQVLI